jgi:hypothetical protein
MAAKKVTKKVTKKMKKTAKITKKVAKKTKKGTRRTTSKRRGGKSDARRKLAPTKRPAKRKLAKPNPTRRKATHKGAPVSAVFNRTVGSPTIPAWKQSNRQKSQSVDTVPFSRADERSRSRGRSGDLQGLSDVESSSSESVDELLEEGNSFEADIVMGVEEAGDAEGREVRTHEVLQDDVPGEYRDRD